MKSNSFIDRLVLFWQQVVAKFENRKTKQVVSQIGKTL